MVIVITTNFEALLQGKFPTLNDYSQFVSVCEKLPSEILWFIANEYTNMHFLLKGVVQKNLEERIPKENIDRALNEIVTKFQIALANQKADS